MTQRVLIEWANEKGYRVGFAEISLLDVVKDKLERLRAKAEFAPGFFEANLGFFKYLEESSIKSPRALLIVAIPRSACILNFELERGSVETTLPPTYVEYRPLFENVRVELKNNVLGKNVRIETLQAPLKSLAAYIGLVSYGRNNITYIPEFGSYFQLAGYILDVPLIGVASEMQLVQKLSLCSSCRACIRACPMGAITEDRFLIHAERCYTLYSESQQPIPASIEPPSPDCLIGCLRCQETCPANKGLLRREKAGISFTKEETVALLDDRDIQDRHLNESIYSKFRTLALTESVPILRRNFRRVFDIISKNKVKE